MLTSVMYEVSTTCPSCGQPLPLNGASESVLCGACQRPLTTPVKMWSTTIGESTTDALGMEEGSGGSATAMLGDPSLTLKYVTGRLSARCATPCKTPYPVDALEALLAQGGGDVFCSACGKKASVRRPPEWFKEVVHPAVVGLVAETLAADSARSVPAEAVRFHCYHCGAPTPLDGSLRSVPCGHCAASLVVPDDIWVRLHPAATIDRWYALIEIGDAVGVVPEDCSDFCDFTVEPSGHMVVAWHDNDEGDVGHRCRIARVDHLGMLVWKQDGIEFDAGDTLIEVSPGDARLVLIDSSDAGFVRFLDPNDGTPTGTLTFPDEDGPSSRLNARDHDGVAIDWDGSFVVNRTWSDTSRQALRRFDKSGARVELWPGLRKPKEDKRVDEVAELRDQPVVVPPGAQIVFGWDGLFHVVGLKGGAIAKYTRDGKGAGVVPLDVGYIERVLAFDVARDGTVYILYRDARRISDSEWPHVLRITADGRSEPWLGPHAADEPLLGRWDDELELLPDGTLFVGYDFSSLRIFAPDKTVRFMSLGTRRRDERVREELEKARRGKRLVADR